MKVRHKENRSLIGFKMAFSSVDGGGVVERETLRQTNEHSMFWWFLERDRECGRKENSSSVEYFFDPFW